MNKKSKQREAILEVLKSTSSHPTAERLYEMVKKQTKEITITTVYRNLRLLKNVGEISEIHMCNSTARFESRIDRHNHFYCEQCGKIIDLDNPVDTMIEARIAADTGIKVSTHQVIFKGLCNDCEKLGLDDNGDSNR